MTTSAQPLARDDEIDGRYRCVKLLGAGAFGEVWKATDLRLDGQAVAVKFLHAHLATQPEVVRRFELEVRSLRQLRASNVVYVSDRGEWGGRPYLVMEYLEGERLSDWIERQHAPGATLDLADAQALLLDVLRGVAEAHSVKPEPVVHRDLKPSNVILSKSTAGERVPKIVDFGLAHSGDLTRTGQAVGTPAYMAPEQHGSAADVTPTADVFALGVMIVEVFTGEHYADAHKNYWWRAAEKGHVGARIDALRRQHPAIPHDVWAVVTKALAVEAEDRYAHARALREAFAAAWKTAPTTPRSPEMDSTLDVESMTLPGQGQTPVPAPAVARPTTPSPPATARAGVESTFRMVSLDAPTLVEMAPEPRPARSSRPWLIGASILLTIGGTAALIQRFRPTREGGKPPSVRPSPPPAPTVISPPTPATAPAPTPTPRPAPAPPPEVPLVSDPGNPWVRIDPPATPVRLGLASDPGREDHTGFRPSANVSSPRSVYFIQQHEVTWGAFDRHSELLREMTLPDGVPVEPERRATLPVMGLSWDLARRYCQEKLRGDLPTEEQWEFAARGPSLRPHPWGSEPLRIGEGGTRAFQSRPPFVGDVLSPGQDVTPGIASGRLHGLAGNAMEWTRDVYRDDSTGEVPNWARSNGEVNYGVRGLPHARSAPSDLPTSSATFRTAYCGSGCAGSRRRPWSWTGFRCVFEPRR